ncbi:hypothetical protein DSO57_1021676 [Entomophthora muscae]|uniref:Uncharacterized protein n=1 Tax=Entomophthora muscae TaxID=34485 RepID=A0ACC2U1U8_9FUNG|nr:hypothetical protein DSO57_1021676 [Entomophthora muscae]
MDVLSLDALVGYHRVKINFLQVFGCSRDQWPHLKFLVNAFSMNVLSIGAVIEDNLNPGGVDCRVLRHGTDTNGKS